MSEQDPLKQATALLRNAHSGHSAAPGHTRARVMASLHRQKKRRSLRLTTLIPIVLALFGGTAWAQSSGALPRIWSTFVAALAPLTESGRALAERERAARQSQRARATAPVPGTPKDLERAEPSIDAQELASEARPETTQPDMSASAAPSAAGQASPRDKSKANPERARLLPERKREVKAQPAATPGDDNGPASGSVNAEVPPSRELAAFRKAHDLHYGGAPAAAIAAYESYIASYPEGRFLPEAHYNIGLDAFRLGRKQLAERHLRPFAAGRYGSYRQAGAKALLEQLGVARVDGVAASKAAE